MPESISSSNPATSNVYQGMSSEMAQANTPSMPLQIIDNTLATGIVMGKSYGFTTLLFAPFEYFGYAERASRLNFSAFSAIAVPIAPRTSLFYEKLLGCNENTPFRNIAKQVASSLTTIAVTGSICNALGYNINTADLINSNLTVLKYTAYATAGVFTVTLAAHIVAQKYFGMTLDELLEEGQEVEQTQSDIQEQIEPFEVTTAVKTEQVKQSVLNQQ